MAKEKRGISINPNFLKLGVTLVFSLGGIVFTFLRSKRETNPISSGNSNQSDSRGEIGESGDGNCDLQENLSPQKVRSCDRCKGDRIDVLLPEAAPSDISRWENGQSLVPEAESPTQNKYAENDECIEEIRSLRSKVALLEERERILEIQLLEYYGLKEQETAVIELHNRLRLSNMEAKLYKVKVESLQSENRKLTTQATEYAKVAAELESANAKIKLLREKLSSKAEQNREQLMNLRERVMKLQDDEKKAVGFDQDLELRIQKKKELEEELEEMKKSNRSLKMENCELARKLECAQILATSVLDNEELTGLKEEGQHLRQWNEDLRREIEQIQEDRCKDIEELVYLRWINACLRYELRNYQPSAGKSVARDLSIMLSPKSEEKAKQLILEYAKNEGYGDNVTSITDLDSYQWSSSCDMDNSPIDNLSANGTNNSRKSRVFTKLMKLWLGKDNDHHTRTPVSPLDVDDSASRYSSISFDIQRSSSCSQRGESSNCPRRNSADNFLSIFRSIDSINGYNNNSTTPIRHHPEAENAAKAELMKYAEALKNSNSHVKASTHQRSASAF